MSLNALGLGFMFTATDLASGVMSNIKQNFQGLEDAANTKVDNLDKLTRRMGGGLTAAFVGLGGLAASFKMATGAADFETAMTKVELKTHATGEEMKGLEHLAFNMAEKMGISAVDAAMGMKMLGQQGYETGEILKKLPMFAKFAAAGDIELSESIDLVSQAMRTFNINSELMQTAMDQMLQSVDMSSGELKELPIGLARALSGAKQFNMTLTDTLMIFNSIKDIVASPMLAGTGTSYIGSRLANPKYAKILKEMTGIDAFDKKGHTRDILGVLSELGPALDKLDDPHRTEMLSKVFGADGTRGVNAFFSRIKTGWKDADGNMRTGIDGMLYNMDKIAGASGNVERNFSQLIENMRGKINRLSATWGELVIVMGRPFMQVWKPILDLAIDGLTKLAHAIADTNPKVKLLIAWGVTLASFGLVFLGMAMLIGAAWPLVVTGLELMGEALLGVIPAIGGAVAALGWWIIPLAGLGAIIYAASENLGGMGKIFSEVGNEFTRTGGVFDHVVTFFKTAWTSFVEGFKKNFDNIPFGAIADAFTYLFDEVEALMISLGFFTPDGDGKFVHDFFHLLGRVIGGVVSLSAQLIGGVAWLGAGLLHFVNAVLKPVGEFIYLWLIRPLLKVLELMQMVSGVDSLTASVRKWSGQGNWAEATDDARRLHKFDLDDNGNIVTLDKDGKLVEPKRANVLNPLSQPNYVDPSSYFPSKGFKRPPTSDVDRAMELSQNTIDRLVAAISKMAPPVISVDSDRFALIMERANERLLRERSGKW